MTIFLEYLWTGVLPVLGIGVVLFGAYIAIGMLMDWMARPINEVNAELKKLNEKMSKMVKEEGPW